MLTRITYNRYKRNGNEIVDCGESSALFTNHDCAMKALCSWSGMGWLYELTRVERVEWQDQHVTVTSDGQVIVI